MQNIEKNISQEAYQQFLDEVVNLVQNHRTKAVQAVQLFSNQLYWNIGELIIKKQKEFGWGKSVVEQLSKDLNHQLGDAISWSPRNLWFMRQLVNEYSIVNQPGSDLKFLNQPGSDSSTLMQAASEIEKVKQLISEVPCLQY